MKPQDVLVALFALAQESRLALFRLLVKRGPDGFTPGELAEKLAIPAPTMSFHLKELTRSGLIAARRDGRFLYYSVNFAVMQGLVDFLMEKCCTLSETYAPTETSCATGCTPGKEPIKKAAAKKTVAPRRLAA